MQLHEKLDYLMNITKTTNSALSRHLTLDASYISRLRRGQRSFFGNDEYIKSIATYMARHCIEEYQRKAVCDAMNISPALLDDNELSELILLWLLDDKSREVKTVERFLDGFTNFKFKKTEPFNLNTQNSSGEAAHTDVELYYGISGKRQAVIRFLTQVLANEKPQTLLLFSDEDTDWMTADYEFARKWAVLMSQVLMQGNRIKIIHTVSRNLDEMLNAINQWMPLYMSGLIEPYYYPKKRDGVFKRTFFIAQDTSAMIAGSVGNTSSHSVNKLFWDKKSVEAFTEEFNVFLSMCKPLMRIFTANDLDAYFSTVLEFENERVDTIVKTESISILTMPESLAAGLITRHNKNIKLLDCYNIRLQNFKKNIQSNTSTEIIQLPDVETVICGKLKLAFSDMLNGGAAYYTVEEYILHLENLVHLLKTHENFHVLISDDTKEEGYMVYAREELGAIVAKTSAPPVVLAMNESNMTAAFWDYLKNTIEKKSYDSPSNKETSNRLLRYIQKLKSSR